MKHLHIIILNFFIPNLFFAAEPVRVERQTERSNSSERTTTRTNLEQERIREEQRIAKAKPKAGQKEVVIEPTRTTQEVVSVRHPHEIDPKTGMSDFEFALKDAARERQNNPALTKEESLQHAKELYEKAKRDYIDPKDFVLHLNTRYNSGHLRDIYGAGKHDVHAQTLIEDLHTIDPYLYKKFADSFRIKQPGKKESVITEENFITWLQENPEYITNPSKFTGKPHEKTPLEDAIELKDTATIEAIIRIAKENKISSELLIQPIRDKFLEILKTEGKDKVTEYLEEIEALGVPELTRVILRNTMRSELEWALETGDMDHAKEALELALENRVSIKFLTKPLIEKYKNMTKSANKYLQKIYDLGNDEVSQFIYKEITAESQE